jgi:hypothetical protein
MALTDRPQATSFAVEIERRFFRIWLGSNCSTGPRPDLRLREQGPHGVPTAALVTSPAAVRRAMAACTRSGSCKLSSPAW